MKRRLQPSPAPPQQPEGDLHVSHQPANPRGFVFGRSPYLTALEAADYVRCVHGDDIPEKGIVAGTPNVRAFYKFVARHGITKLGAGRALRFDRADLDAALRRRAGGLRRVS